MGLTNIQYNTIMRDYQRQQNKNRQELAAREEEIYRRFPQFSEIDAQIAAASTACARILLDEQDTDTVHTVQAQIPAARQTAPAPSDTAHPARAQIPAARQTAPAPSDTAHPARAQIPAAWQTAPVPSDTAHPAQAQTASPAAQTSEEIQEPVARLRTQIAGFSARKAELLQQAGYPKDYLSMHYRCPDCQDTGYIGQEKCHCFRQAIIDLLYTQSNLRDVLREENFSSFSLAFYSDRQIDPVTGLSAAQTARRALEECRRFVRDFDHSFENIFLYGDTGLGKTFLSHCIAKELLEHTHSVIYFSAFRLFELFADSAFGRTEELEAGELERHIFECDFLIIDDLGTELVNSFVSSQLFLVLNERILRRKSTLISTNLSLATFADTYSERVFSRISSNYIMLKLIGDDIRLRKKISAGKA